MGRIQEILETMKAANGNIAGAVEKQKRDGKKIVGVLPVYAPEALVHAAGMFPVGCWGGVTTISKAAKYLPPFACTIMQAVMEFAESGVYRDLDAFLVPVPCDTLKAISQNLIYACKDKKVIIISYPQNNRMECAVTYTKTELSKVRAKLEELCGQKIPDAKINESLDIYNAHSAAMMDFFKAVSAKPGIVSALQRHALVKAGYFMPKEEHTRLVTELNKLIAEAPAPGWKGKKIVLAGIMAEPDNILELFDEFRLAVAGDELAQETRQFRTPFPAGSDPIERMARQWQNVECCSVVLDAEKKRAKHIADMAAENKADGIVYCQMKFCDPEEFDFPSVAEACKSRNIPLLNLEIDQLSESTGQARTRIQAFSEQIGA
jgi:benzoyl-CoA reductase/2-hydroxyglutaryl-CoA dehydratase subunit BcrC/BadD/HgdB